MTKFLLLVLSFFVVCNSCNAQRLELSDVIKEARELEMKKSLISDDQKDMIQPVTNQTEKTKTIENSLEMQCPIENSEKNLDDKTNIQ